MAGFAAFLAKELREIVRTWRLWVLPGMLVFFALAGPPLARLTPEILDSVVSEQQPGVVIQIPDPTYRDAYLQWAKNLSQVVLFALILTSGGMISGERRSGTAALVLTKPLSRSAFVLAKYAANAALLLVATAAGTLITWGVTYLTFGAAPPTSLFQATGAWLVFALLVLAWMEMLSASFGSTAGAAGLGFAGFALLGIAALFPFATRYTPAGLLGAPSAVLTASAGPLGWPIATALLAAVVFVAAAVAIFRRREL